MRTLSQRSSYLSSLVARPGVLVTILISLQLLICGPGSYARMQETSSAGDKERRVGKTMLATTKRELKSKYYDKSLHGMDIETRFKIAEDRIAKATSIGEIYGIIAQVVLELNDSHTYFVPPPWVMHIDYGFDLQMIGDACRVISVRLLSDAETNALMVGDEILSVDGIPLTRENFSRFRYLYYILRPKKKVHLVVQNDSGKQREMEIKPEIEPLKRSMGLREFIERQRADRLSDPERSPQTFEFGKDLFVLKLPSFSILSDEIDRLVKKARDFKSMIIDLRRDSGGYEVTLQRLVGHFFDRDIKIASVRRRAEMKDIVAKTRGKNVFTGRIVVLVDSLSASAAEAFARVIQLEKRGVVLGDRTSGSVMRSVHYNYQVGEREFVPYMLSITDADLIMTDGKSLEHGGVMPDEVVLPTREDIIARRDDVLARAAQILGVTLDAARAGSLFRRRPVEKDK